MPAEFDKRQLRSLSLRVASNWLKLAFSMDEYARLSMLEGFAGVKPGSWVRKGRRGMGMAQEKFPHAHPNWTTTRSTGVYDQAVAGVKKLLSGAGATSTAAEDVLQELNENAATSSGPDYKRIFWAVGNTNRSNGKDKDLAGGKLAPNHSLIGGTLNKWLRQKALNVIQSKKEQMETSYGMSVGPDEYDPFSSVGTEALTDEDRMRLLLMAMKSRSSVGNRVRDFIDREIGSKWSAGDAKIVRLFMSKLSDPKWSVPTASWLRDSRRKGDPRPEAEQWFQAVAKKIGAEIAEELGLKRQRISNVLGGGGRKVIKFMESLGDKANVESLIEAFADEIEYLEVGPGINIRGSLDLESELEEEQKPQQAFDSVQTLVEKDRVKDWDEAVSIDTHIGEDEDMALLIERVAHNWLSKQG